MKLAVSKTTAQGIVIYCDLCDSPMRHEKYLQGTGLDLLRCENLRCRAVRHVYRKWKKRGE